jgi:decaprenyl-phosphate phosphoribosyltransferase
LVLITNKAWQMRRIKNYVRLMRPHHYVKNGFVGLPLFFGHKLYDIAALCQTFWAFLAFCTAASTVYILNDLQDRETDRYHPSKRQRPLASGAMRPSEAVWLFFILLAISLAISSIFLAREFLFIIAAYLFLNLAYSWKLKRQPIIDVVCVAMGFVLRVFGGGIAAHVFPSQWLVLMTFLLALFLAFSKRRDELLLAGCGYKGRECLDGYSVEYLSLSMVLMAAVIIVCYIFYTLSPEVLAKHHTNMLYLTSFWVVIGLLRYMQITIVVEETGSPTRVLIRDGFLKSVVILWIATCYIILYNIRF